MEEVAVKTAMPLFEYGALGIVVVGLSLFILWLIKQHKDERKEIANTHREERGEWKDTIVKVTTETQALAKDFRDFASQVSRIK